MLICGQFFMTSKCLLWHHYVVYKNSKSLGLWSCNETDHWLMNIRIGCCSVESKSTRYRSRIVKLAESCKQHSNQPSSAVIDTQWTHIMLTEPDKYNNILLWTCDAFILLYGFITFLVYYNNISQHWVCLCVGTNGEQSSECVQC